MLHDLGDRVAYVPGTMKGWVIPRRHIMEPIVLWGSKCRHSIRKSLTGRISNTR